MRELPDFPDDLIDDLLEGRADAERTELGNVLAFVHELRSVNDDGPEPRVDQRLATVLARGLTTDKGDLPVTAGSNANGSAAIPPQTAGPPMWRRLIDRSNDRMDTLGRSTRTKVAAAAAAVIVGTMGVGAAGALPGPAQDAADRAFEAVGLDRATTETEDVEIPEVETGNDDVEAQDEKPEGAGVDGSTVSGAATGDDTEAEATPEDGAEFGEWVSDDASEHGTTTASDASDGASDTSGTLPEQAPIGSAPPADAGSQSESAPEDTPDADSNPGTQFQPDQAGDDDQDED